MFIGEFFYTIDNKGRVVMPAGFRSELKGKLYVSRGFDRCLYVYDEHEWQAQQERLVKMSEFGQEERNLKRLIYSGMNEVSFDGQGRIKLSQPLLNYAGIEKDVAIVGVNSRIEIWDKAKWELFLAQNEADIERLAGHIDSKIHNSRKD
ncbi:division/cell wall cluster transcriptional repressor MraZ [bacterium]|nr:division/cell wall cluster transcriptional repressor MraZ [bacterium]MCP5461771.1 division/cell wall cluster transcriptional repressor MraZ [bacterium]